MLRELVERKELRRDAISAVAPACTDILQLSAERPNVKSLRDSVFIAAKLVEASVRPLLTRETSMVSYHLR